MLPAEFDYAAPESLEDALALLADGDNVRILAGGQSLLPTLKLRLDRPDLLVDLRKIPELSYVREEEREIVIGALTTYADLMASDLLGSGCARSLAEAAAAVGDLQVRNLGTIGGSLSHADPAADLPAAVLALDASLVARSEAGDRTIAASEFFRGLWATALEPGEILREIRFPNPVNGGGAYEKLRQAASGFALVGAAAVVEMDGSTIAGARVALTGVASGPLRLHALEERLIGETLGEELVRGACDTAGEAIEDPLADAHASAEYRTAMAGVVARRAVLRAGRLVD
jgi:carbon-monoxide dehydrogenase medium subunit